MSSSGYDDRRMVAPPATAYDERYAALGADRRAVMDPSIPQTKPAQTGYDRTQTDIYSRRDPLAKPLDRAVPNYSTTTAAYAVAATPSYAQMPGGWVAGGYGDGRTTAATMGYDPKTVAQPGAYGDTRSTIPQAYDARATNYQMATTMYPDGRSVPVSTMGSYSSVAVTNYGTPTSYTTVQTTAYDPYGTTRNGSYDASYPPLPQQRSYASGGGPAPRRDMPPGPGRRY